MAVVLNHREADATRRLLEVLGRIRRLEVIVVDNASGPADLMRLGPVTDVVETGANLGYAGGNNVGIRIALERGADAVWILNPDAEPARGALRHLQRALTGDPSVGVVGGTLVSGSAEMPTVQSRGGRIVWERGGRSELIDAGTPLRRGVTGVREVDFVPGAAMLVRRAVFESVGLLPEDYFMYFEETEFCVRVARAGWRVVVEPRAVVTHHSARRSGLPSEVYLYYFLRNRILFGRRHTAMTVDDLRADADDWVTSWRSRVERVDPGWLPRFEALVAKATEDARAGITGRRDGVG